MGQEAGVGGEVLPAGAAGGRNTPRAHKAPPTDTAKVELTLPRKNYEMSEPKISRHTIAFGRSGRRERRRGGGDDYYGIAGKLCE